jgi:hypothetical protein
MSSVGFVPGDSKDIEQLREAWQSLNALLNNITNAEACLQNHDLKLTADHLKVAKWNLGEVKKAIAMVGQARKGRSSITQM